jgi:hypothetical protein
MASVVQQFDQKGRWANLRKAPKSSLQTRVALIVHQRGITKKQLEKFCTMRGKHFDYMAFAKKYNISLDWLSMGILAEHPRLPAPRDKRSSQQATPTEMRELKATVHGCPLKCASSWISEPVNSSSKGSRRAQSSAVFSCRPRLWSF